MRGLRIQSRTEIDGFSGIFTTTVWQALAVRNAFVRDLVLKSLVVIVGLIASLGLIVWFGIRLGLKPLDSLQQAIDLRTSDDLSPIKRKVPVEVQGIVTTLNRLLRQVSDTMAAQNDFISNAAHQLRNPIAGVLSLAESVRSAKSGREAQVRAEDLVHAAKETSDLAQKMLAYERARTVSPQGGKGNVFCQQDAGFRRLGIQTCTR